MTAVGASHAVHSVVPLHFGHPGPPRSPGDEEAVTGPDNRRLEPIEGDDLGDGLPPIPGIPVAGGGDAPKGVPCTDSDLDRNRGWGLRSGPGAREEKGDGRDDGENQQPRRCRAPRFDHPSPLELPNRLRRSGGGERRSDDDREAERLSETRENVWEGREHVFDCIERAFGCQGDEQMFGSAIEREYDRGNLPRRTMTRTSESGLTHRQQAVLAHIRRTVAERGYPPSVREICDAVGLSSPSTVHSHLTALEKAGFIRRDPTKPRAIEVLDGTSRADDDRVRSVPLVGRIAAGVPILAEENVDDVLPLPVELVGTGSTFLLRVSGDSMIGAGILDGDLVAVRSQPDAEDGEIVAALLDGEEATVKRLHRRDGLVLLVAENPAYPPIERDRDVSIMGKVVSVLRRLR